MEREPDTEYVLSLSYGKDSLATLEAIKQLGLPLDRIIHAEVWATDEIPADLPPMVEFKKKADAIIKERYGIEVEHVCAMRKRESQSSPMELNSTPNDLTETEMETLSTDSLVPSTLGAIANLNETLFHECEEVKWTYEREFYRIPKRREEKRREEKRSVGMTE